MAKFNNKNNPIIEKSSNNCFLQTIILDRITTLVLHINMDFRTAMYEFCTFFMQITVSNLDNSLNKSSFSSTYIKSTVSPEKRATAATLNDISKCFVYDTIIESTVILFVHLETEFNKDKENYLKNKSVDKISQLLDYLLSPAFLLTKFSQKFHSADKVKLESVKKSIGSIFIEKYSFYSLYR